MKRKLSAIAYTLFFSFTVLATPVFFEWYMVEVLHRTNDLANAPFSVWMLSLFLFMGQLALAFYLWIRVFDKKIK